MGVENMSNVAYKSNLEPKRVHREVEQPKKEILKRGRITLGEKLIALIAVFAIAIFAISIISVQTSIYSVNKSIEASEEKLLSQQKTNDDLKVQVNDLGRYERILKLAKEKGLSLNGDNVKVVDGK